MALLQDIIAEATRTGCDVTSLLRKAFVLASRLKNDELKAWVTFELNGYPNVNEVPAYRKTDVQSYGYFADRFIGKGTLQVPVTVLPNEYREKFSRVVLQQPIKEMVDLHRRNVADGTANIQFPWPTALRKCAQKVSELECISVWRQLDPSFVAGIIDTVQTRILSMSLELEAADPTAGDVPSTSPNISETQVSKIINNHIHGTVLNFSAGGDYVTQNVTLNVAQGDKNALLHSLKGAGVADDDLLNLSNAIDADQNDGTQPKQGMGARAKQWLGELQIKAAQGLGGLSMEVVSGVITQAIISYFGLGS